MILKADLHIHSFYSNLTQSERWPGFLSKIIVDSRHTIENVFQLAKKSRLDIISITDHDEIQGCLEALNTAKKYNITVIPGTEVTTGEGDLLAYNIFENVPTKMGLKKTIEYIKERNGIVVAPHIFSPGGIFHKLRKEFLSANTNIEKFNVQGIDAIDIYSYIMGKADKAASKYADKKNLPKIAGSDSKVPTQVGNVYTEIDVKSNSIPNILAAIKNGRTWPVIAQESNLFFNVIEILRHNYLKTK